MRIKRILIVHPHLIIFGGAEILLCHFTHELIEAGIDVKLVSLSLSEESRKRFDSRIKFVLPSHEIKYKLRSTGFFTAMGVLPEMIRLKKMVKRESNDVEIINVHNFPATWAVSKRLGKLVVWMCNEPPALWNNPNPSRILKMAVRLGGYIDRRKIEKHIDKTIVSDKANYERTTKLYGNKPGIVNYGVEYDFFAEPVRTNIKEEYSLDDSTILLHVGYFSPQKNQLQSAKLLNQIRDKVPGAKLLFAGQGENEYEEKTKHYVKEHSLEDRVLFLGHVNRERIRELYQAADIALFPTRGQGGWLSPFEAISAGVPIIVSSELTASDIIESNQLGHVADDFVEPVLDIIGDTNRAKRKTESAQRWVKKHLSWQKYAERMMNVFNESMSQKGSHGQSA